MNRLYNALGLAAPFLIALAPALFFGWHVYAETLALTGVAWLSVLGGVSCALGLEFIGFYGGHVASEAYRQHDRRWIVAAAIFLAYVAIGAAALTGVQRVAYLLAPLGYALLAMASTLEDERQDAQAEANTLRAERLQAARERRAMRHEERLAALSASTELAQSDKEPAQSGHECGQCGRMFASMQAVNAHKRFCGGNGNHDSL